MKKQFRTLIAATALLAGLPVSCGLAASSDWFETDGARIRLISMPGENDGIVEAGLQFELEKGWKTYWRAPGASGLPPQIHFLGSQNVQSAKMALPIPKAFNDKTGKSIGYKNHVVFPISLIPKTAGKEVVLKATGVVGVCAEICIPVQFELSVTQKYRAGTTFEIAALLNRAKTRLPAAAHAEQRINTLSRSGTRPRLLQIKTRVPAGTSKLALFVEGPSSWYLSSAKLLKQVGQQATFTIDLQDAPEQADIAATLLRFTLVADENGVEQSLKIGPVH